MSEPVTGTPGPVTGHRPAAGGGRVLRPGGMPEHLSADDVPVDPEQLVVLETEAAAMA
ncbi:hypothetical protein ACFWHQ_34160 [Streptomyces sp. NPDC060334]|uniref:hypothetical protein n=1 Tax=Streptomyces sp. NPDC060334 TaxID=3347099 RepID=UPI003660B921